MVNLGPVESLKDLNEERASYVFLRGEMNPTPGSAVDKSFDDLIADVDKRIRANSPPKFRDIGELAATGRAVLPSGETTLPLPNPRIVTRGYRA